ncbi:MAG: nucleotidyltransferase family protein [Kiritimatiellae bacterium]|nr:nucleotidyltransferase family protein [Kiritimatiellia bacterium]
MPIPPVSPVAAILLAAGASSRMGTPKALLPTTDGLPLAARQLLLLHEAGFSPLILVAGKHHDRIRDALAGLPSLHDTPFRLIDNQAWPTGRLSSVQAGLRALSASTPAALLLPVDAAGIRLDTFRAIRDAWLAVASAYPAQPIRPFCNGQKGNALLVPAALFKAVLALPPDARLDEWARPRAWPLPLHDPALLANYNTPADWAARPV